MSLFKQVFVFAFEHQFTALVVHCGPKDHHAGRALRLEIAYYQHGINHITGVNGPQELR